MVEPTHGRTAGALPDDLRPALHTGPEVVAVRGPAGQGLEVDGVRSRDPLEKD